MQPLLTSKEAAKLLQIHEKTLQKLAREGKIPAIQIGTLWRFDLVALEQWVQDQLSKGRGND